jgi:hypothetical protein
MVWAIAAAANLDSLDWTRDGNQSFIERGLVTVIGTVFP